MSRELASPPLSKVVRLGDAIEIGPVSLTFRREVDYEEWAAVGDVLQRLEGSMMWYLGDWLRYGDGAFAEYSQVVPELVWKKETLYKAVAVADRVEKSLRRPFSTVLTWSHFKVVAYLEPAVREELLDAAESSRWSTRQLAEAVRSYKRELAALSAGPLPEGTYRVLYADPPWEYERIIHGHGAAEDHYSTLALEEIQEMDIRSLAADDAVLFLWITAPKLREGLEVAEAWGFTYKASFVWDKVRHNFGHYNSVRHELLLIATRGSCTPDSSRLHDSVITEERTGHSVKPEQFRRLIDELYPPPEGRNDRIELFSRKDSPEWWDAWGAEEPQVGTYKRNA
jgi:N6-adenosine-specific RNA methylase IME4